mgnify:CR=1 FL=1
MADKVKPADVRGYYLTMIGQATAVLRKALEECPDSGEDQVCANVRSAFASAISALEHTRSDVRSVHGI